MTKGYVVSGTDTGIGKTVFAAGLTGSLRGCYWKPVQSGLEGGSDSNWVSDLTAGLDVVIHREAYRLTTPCSPHQAAAIDGVVIDPARLALPDCGRPLVVEGAGGVLVPVNDDLLFADLFALWDLPVILVARTALGTINHSLLSVEALRGRNIAVHGIAFVGDENVETRRAICDRSGARDLGRLPILVPLNAARLAESFAANIRTELLI